MLLLRMNLLAKLINSLVEDGLEVILTMVPLKGKGLFLQKWYNTVWKFPDFSITQILREINFENSRSAKYAVFTHLEAVM